MLIEIYGMTGCGFCTQATVVCQEAGLDYIYIDLAKSPEMMEELESRIGRFKTVPQIFMDGTHIGGFAELKEAMRNNDYN